MVIGLGGLNLFGVIILGTMLKYGSVNIPYYCISVPSFILFFVIYLCFLHCYGVLT